MEYIKFEIKDHIGIVTLDRPPVNSINLQMYGEIKETFETINTLNDVRVVVISSACHVFSSGNDINEFNDIKLGEAAERYVEIAETYGQSVNDCMQSIYNCRVPLIAAVNGAAVGAGLAIAACCDLIVASEGAQFVLPEIKVGVLGAAGFLAQLVPEKVVRYAALTGNPLSAEEIRQYGGIHRVVPAAQLLEAAMALAQEFLQVGPLALRYYKQAINENVDARLPQKYSLELEYTKKYVQSEDMAEAIAAFVEKRKPNYRGV